MVDSNCDGLVSVPKLSGEWDVPDRTIRYWAETDVLRGLKIDNKWWFPADNVRRAEPRLSRRRGNRLGSLPSAEVAPCRKRATRAEDTSLQEEAELQLRDVDTRDQYPEDRMIDEGCPNVDGPNWYSGAMIGRLGRVRLVQRARLYRQPI
jgi:hypothetical protein